MSVRCTTDACSIEVATSVTVNRSLEYFGTVRGRLGYAVTPTLLFYATGGLAYGGIATSTAVNQSLTPSLLLSAGAKERFLRQPRRLDGRRRSGIGADWRAVGETGALRTSRFPTAVR
jgi:opacity protein-like surface antigen